MTKQQRTELEDLSLQAFGSKNRYKKVMERGELINGMSKTKTGTDLKIRTVERPDVDQMIQIMKDAIEEKAKEKELKEKKQEEGKDEGLQSSLENN
jgi:hypothetical protein